MNNLDRVVWTSRFLRTFPIPGRYVQRAIGLADIDLTSIPTPYDCRDRWNTFSIRLHDPSDLVERHILLQGYFEYYESRYIRSALKPGDTFVDIGANIGWHTLLAAHAVGNSGRVFAFEPVKRTFEHLSENISLNGLKNVTLVNAGLSDEATTADIYAPDDHNVGGFSLFKASDSDDRVDVVSLLNGDAFFDEQGITKIDLCKIDVEGAELNVLKGLAKTLAARRIKNIIIEANGEALNRSGHSVPELIVTLKQYGFRLFGLRNPNKEITEKDEQIPGANLICRLSH